MSANQDSISQHPRHASLQHDYQGNCWWCGSPADSREHRHKKSDVVRSFGSAPWTGGVVRVRSGSDREERIQGPNSDKLKFARVLCATCNNARSQPFDLAYEDFATFAHRNTEAIVKVGSFRLFQVYGRDWRNRRRDLGRYFVKSICCRLAEDKVLVPQALKDYMDGTLKVLPNLDMQMNINMAKYELGKHMTETHGESGGSLWLGDHGYMYGAHGQVEGTYSHLGFDWFNLDYQFHFSGKKGRTNFFAGDTVRLERFWPEGMASGDVARVCQDCNKADGERPVGGSEHG